jgi:hypothetical protein
MKYCQQNAALILALETKIAEAQMSRVECVTRKNFITNF